MIKCKRQLPPIFLMVILSGCSSEPVHVASTDRPIKKLIQPHLLPDSVYTQISSAIESGGWKTGQMKEIESALCNGTAPRLSIKRFFVYRPPDTAGLPLDEAKTWRKFHLAQALRFLKNDFFYYTGQAFNGVNQPEDMDQPLRDDLLDTLDSEAYQHRNFVNGSNLLEKTYAARFFKPLYFHEGGYADMQFLFQRYAFRVPLEVINKFEKLNPTPHIKLPADNHYFGYDQDDSGIEVYKFFPSLAIEHQDFLWRWIAKNSTSVEEAELENGNTRFLVEMKLDLFCKYVVRIEELRSR